MPYAYYNLNDAVEGVLTLTNRERFKMIPCSRFTSTWLRERLRDSGEPVSSAGEVDIEQIGQGRGFCSLIYRVSVDGHSYAIKITGLQQTPLSEATEHEREMAAFHRDVHAREMQAYAWFNLQRDADDAGAASKLQRVPLTIARLYAAEEATEKYDGIIVMDDFSSKIVTSLDWVKGYDETHVLSIIEQVVGFQFASLAATASPPEFPPNVKLREIFCEFTVDCIEKLPWLSERQIKIIKECCVASNVLATQCDTYGLEPVIIHCDFWPNNLLFQKEASQADATVLAVLDWQAVSTGCCLVDVTSAIVLSLTPETRRARENSLLRAYVEGIRKRCEEGGITFDITFELARALYTRCMRYSLLQMTMTAAFHPQFDQPEEGAQLGPLSQRLNALLEDIIADEDEHKRN